MWTRVELKSNAKQILKGYYWMAVLVCFIAGLLGAEIKSGTNFKINYNVEDYIDRNINDFEDLNQNFVTSILGNVTGIDASEVILVKRILGLFGIFAILAFIFGIIFSLFISAPIQVGKNAFFMKSREEDVSIGSLFYSFSSGNYLNIVKVMFLKQLYIFLWSLLFIIPGIIKSYEYYMVSYILTENPNIDYKRAFEISKAMTEGEKLNIFILELSFIGWYILAGITFGLGYYFINPYINATFAELYTYMREKAIVTGIVTQDELPGYEKQGYTF